MGKRLDAIAGRHAPTPDGTSMRGPRPGLGVICWRCAVPWPCDAAVLLMHIARCEPVPEPGTEEDHAD